MNEVRQRWRLYVERGPVVRDVAHRDVVAEWEAAIASSGLPFSAWEKAQGGPRPRVTFAAPVPVGMLAEREPMDVALLERLRVHEVREAVSHAAPAGYYPRYFSGEPDDFLDVSIELDGATEFERELTEALRRIGRGETVTYGELAALAGRPNAQRAAGSFCARNRFAIVVPCHRVVAADGLGSYGSLGVDYKRRLLELEGVAV